MVRRLTGMVLRTTLIEARYADQIILIDEKVILLKLAIVKHDDSALLCHLA
jgi:hypothetical protein